MNILKKLEQKIGYFNDLQQSIGQLQNQLIQVQDEQKRVQGEIRLLQELGIEAGIFNADGTLTIPNPSEEGSTTPSEESSTTPSEEGSTTPSEESNIPESNVTPLPPKKLKKNN